MPSYAMFKKLSVDNFGEQGRYQVVLITKMTHSPDETQVLFTTVDIDKDRDLVMAVLGSPIEMMDRDGT